MTGAWTPRRGRSTAMALLVDRRPLIIRSVRDHAASRCSLQLTAHAQMPYLLFFSLFMICAGLTLPRSSGASCWYIASS